MNELSKIQTPLTHRIYITHCIHSLTQVFIQCSTSTRTYLLYLTDTVRTVSSGKTETDQSNVHAFAHVIISTTLGTVI